MITNKNVLIPTKSFYLFRQNLSNISDLIVQQPDANFLSTGSHNLFLLFIIMKLLLRNMSISFLKNALYCALSWLSGPKALVKMYPKFKLNFSKRSISKWIIKIVHNSAFFVRYYGVLIGGFESDSTFLVNIHFIFCFYILFISCDILRWFWVLVIGR